MRYSFTRVGVMLRLRIFWSFMGSWSTGTVASLPSSSGAPVMIYTLATRLS